MKILVIGSGGREHALAWRLAEATRPTSIASPGNPGIAASRQDRARPSRRLPAARRVSPTADLTVVGPEAPLVAGIVDAFPREGLPIVGPAAEAARLEGSKIFAKQFMDRRRNPHRRVRQRRYRGRPSGRWIDSGSPSW